MAKKSVKARQRKSEKMVAKYAEKRAALKSAGDWQALDELAKECFQGTFEKPLPVNWSSQEDISVISVFPG